MCGQAVNNRPPDIFPPCSHCMIEPICLHAQYVTSEPEHHGEGCTKFSLCPKHLLTLSDTLHGIRSSAVP